MRKKAIIFGGAFNPPTRAHAQILQEVATFAEATNQEVWLLPSGNRSDKTINTPSELRLKYLECLALDIETTTPITIETMELYRQIPVETYDTVKELSETYPDYDLTWVFGADSTETMHTWQQGTWLLQNLNMLLIDRAGSTINTNVRHYHILNIHTPDISSTLLRECLESRRNYEDLVTPHVYQALTLAFA